MKNRLHSFILLILLTFIFAACHASAVATGSDPAGSTSAYHNGDRPFSQVRAEDISTIQIAISRDSMPPGWPNPVKTITAAEDIRRIVEALQPLHLLQQFTWGDNYTMSHMPIGLDGFSVALYCKDDTILRFYLYGEDCISMDSPTTYAIDGLPQHAMGQLYDSLSYEEEKWTPKDPVHPYDLFLLDGWRYFTADAQDADGHRVLQLQRYKSSAMLQVIADQLSEPVNVWTDGKRVVYLGIAEGTNPTTSQPRLYSVNLDGSDKRTLPPQPGNYLNLCWDDGKLYYISGNEDDPYPHSLYSASADFTKTAKAMDIPGPLLTVSAGKVYCLSADRSSLLQLPDAKEIKRFVQSVKSFSYDSTFKQYEFLCADGKHYAWKP